MPHVEDDTLHVAPIRYISLIVGIAVTALSVIVYIYANREKPNIEGAMSLAAAGVALTALVYSAMNVQTQHRTLRLQKSALEIQQRAADLQQKTIDMQQEDARQRRRIFSSNLIMQWTSPETTKITTLAKALKKDLKDLNPREVADFLQNHDPDREKYLSILLVLNFLENMAMSIKYELADETILRDYFRDTVRWYYFSLQTFIQSEIDKYESDAIFFEFRKLVTKWGQLPKHEQ